MCFLFRQRSYPLRLHHSYLVFVSFPLGFNLDEDMNNNVSKKEENDEEEPDIDEFDRRRAGEGAREIGEERVKNQECSEGHHGTHIKRIQPNEESRPAHHQEEDRRQESRHDNHALASMELKVDTHVTSSRAVRKPDVLHSVQGQGGCSQVQHLPFLGREEDVALVGLREAKFHQTFLDIKGISIQFEIAGELAGVVSRDGEVISSPWVYQI